MFTPEIIALAANLALTLSFIVGLILGVAQVKAANRDRKERFTLDTLRNFQTPEFCALMYDINARNFPQNAEKWRSQPAADQVSLLTFGQQMENLGILVAEGYIKLDLVDKTLGSFVVTSWEKFKPGILDLRIKMEDPFLCEYFQWLAGQVSERMEKNPRKPFNETGKTAV
jgi:hypothetical protein